MMAHVKNESREITLREEPFAETLVGLSSGVLAGEAGGEERGGCVFSTSGSMRLGVDEVSLPRVVMLEGESKGP